MHTDLLRERKLELVLSLPNRQGQSLYQYGWTSKCSQAMQLSLYHSQLGFYHKLVCTTHGMYQGDVGAMSGLISAISKCTWHGVNALQQHLTDFTRPTGALRTLHICVYMEGGAGYTRLIDMRINYVN